MLYETDEDDFYLFDDEENPKSVVNAYKRSPIFRLIANESNSRKLIYNSDLFFEQNFITEMKGIFPSFQDFDALSIYCREIGPSKLEFISKIITLYLSRKMALPDFIQKLSMATQTHRQLFNSLIKLISAYTPSKPKKKRNTKGDQKRQVVSKQSAKDTEDDGGNELSDDEILAFIEQDEEELEDDELRDILFTIYHKVPFDISAENENQELMDFMRKRFDSIIADYKYRQRVHFGPLTGENKIGNSSDSSEHQSQQSQNNTKSIGRPNDFIVPAKLLLALYGDVTYGTELEYLIKHFCISNALIMPPPIAPIIRTFMNFCAEANSYNKTKDIPELSIIQETILQSAAESFNASLNAVKTAKRVFISKEAGHYLNKLIEQMNEVFSDPSMVEFTKIVPEKNEVKFANNLHKKYGDTLIRISLNKSGQKTVISEDEVITTTVI